MDHQKIEEMLYGLAERPIPELVPNNPYPIMTVEHALFNLEMEKYK